MVDAVGGRCGGGGGGEAGGQTRRMQRTGGSPRKGEGRENLRGQSVAGRGPKRFQDLLWEHVMDNMHQDKDNEGGGGRDG